MSAYCWVCDGYLSNGSECLDCGAPDWAVGGPGGVYIIQANCGLVKIGMSRRSVHKRAELIVSLARHRARVLTLLPGATPEVERWLHQTFGDIRDPYTATIERLPHHTEWFWPSPSIERLACGEPFLRGGDPWEEADPIDPQPWAPTL